MWRIAEQHAIRRRLAPGGGDACRQPRCRYVRNGMIPVLVAELAAMEIEKLFIVMAVIGLVGLVSTVVYLLAR
jgi:hypothetical protein